jgi:hypothetical protein
LRMGSWHYVSHLLYLLRRKRNRLTRSDTFILFLLRAL